MNNNMDKDVETLKKVYDESIEKVWKKVEEDIVERFPEIRETGLGYIIKSILEGFLIARLDNTKIPEEIKDWSLEKLQLVYQKARQDGLI